MRLLHVDDPGLFTTVQDLGRPGYTAIGVPHSGAADSISLIIGNRLLGNADCAAALECTLTGPIVTLHSEGYACLTGAQCPNASITRGDNQRPLPWCEPTHIAAGESIRIGGTGNAARAYLCISGGLAVPPALGSRSTLVGASLGGHGGRALRPGDVLPLGSSTPDPRSLPRELHAWLRPRLDRRTVRVVPSLHTDMFPRCAIDQLTSSRFAVSGQSDRIGVRLTGPVISPPEGSGVLESEPTVTGGIQIAGDSQPIILGADRPTTGGYPLLACVIRDDLPVVAMLRPRDILRIECVSLSVARRLTEEQCQKLDTLLPACADGPVA